ncbi:hypothetical protein HNY73_022931 [Argiope bruennichi]|uniref:Uncharacterized protein n=1 Tax=Argiope bruennichi TaxID=94029 RepID=A0A8T0E3R7_ARGBR|nr:hypothetical protein HNY73_022931 [Argiope bruennichi]
MCVEIEKVVYSKRGERRELAFVLGEREVVRRARDGSGSLVYRAGRVIVWRARMTPRQDCSCRWALQDTEDKTHSSPSLVDSPELLALRFVYSEFRMRKLFEG